MVISSLVSNVNCNDWNAVTHGQQNSKWTLRSEGSDLNLQLTLTGEQASRN